MRANCYIIGLSTFKNKADKTSYLTNLVLVDDQPDTIGYRVVRAFTSEKHYNRMTDLLCDPFYDKDSHMVTGYLSFENGYTKFYLPKEEVE